jgi:hypothetical protein
MTVGTLYSVAELQDLLAAKDPDLASMEAQFHTLDPQWRKLDPKADNAWLSDYNALKTRYSIARAAAAATIAAASILPDAVLPLAPADPQYRMILKSLQSTEGLTSPGDFQDLFQRLADAKTQIRNAQGLPYEGLFEPPVAQPRRGSDADEAFIKGTNWASSPSKVFGWTGVILALFGIGAGALYLRGGRPIVIVQPRRGR